MLLRHQEDHKNKKGIFLTGRVHPGEAPSSWMMKGILEFLVSSSPQAKQLRTHYVFRIIPMLNPDGVIYGNYRCSLLGYDLNRKWNNPNRILQPTIYFAKQAIKFMSEEREILYFCDLHAHSMQKNVFMYGCTHQVGEANHIQKNANVRVIPLLLSQSNSNFSYKSTRFRIEKSKESTARVVVFKEFHITNSFTCEASFFG